MATTNETLNMILTAEDRTSGIFGRVGLSIGALTAAVGGLVAVAKQVANVGDALDKMSIKTGIGVEALSSLRLAAQLNDTSLEELQIGIQIMQRNLADAAQGAGEAQAALRGLNISQKDMALGMKDASGFLERFAIQLFKIEDPARRSQIAMDVLGRSGVQLLPLLQDIANRGLKGLREESDRLGVTWTKQMTEASQRFNDSLTRLGESMNSFKLKFIGPLIQAFADLADKMGLGGPEAQKRITLENRLSAIEQVRLALNQQIQAAAELRVKGVRSGIAADEVYNALLNKGNELMSERERLHRELNQLAGQKPSQAPGEAANIQQITQMTTALNVVKERIDELFKAGVAPATEEFRKMLETIRQVEILAATAFGVEMPGNLRKVLSETNSFVNELARAAKIDIGDIAKDLPPILGAAGVAAQGFGRIWDSETGEVIATLDESKNAGKEFSNSLKTAGGEVLKLETQAQSLPKTLEEWKGQIAGVSEQFRIVNTTLGPILTNLSNIEAMIARINAQGGIKVVQ